MPTRPKQLIAAQSAIWGNPFPLALLNWINALKALREMDVLLGDSPYHP